MKFLLLLKSFVEDKGIGRCGFWEFWCGMQIIVVCRIEQSRTV